MAAPQPIIPVERIASRIYLIRGEKVMLDSDLAELYGVTTGNLNKAVKRNDRRFPADFSFQLTDEEAESLLFQIGRSKGHGRGGHRTPPFAFTEHSVAMLSSVLSSDRAADANVAIMRTFVELRGLLASNKDLAREVEQLDHDVAVLYDNFRKLLEPARSKK